MKKLFSYLLISSMVVLSSCTNYDDQFDDLNTQINSLKSQIEGFSSLSSGLTALQGTVSSLQSAVAALPKTATPATDISGLEASVAALQTSLASASTSAEVTAITTQLTAAQAALADAIAANATAADANATSIAGNATAIANLLTELETLATSLTAIKADLAAADTSAEVTALTTALAAAQADLTKLLEQNKIYTGDVIISNASTLAAVEALGDKVSIVNGNVYITQSSTAIDATKLQAVVSKMTTVTGAVSYTHSGTGVTAVNFDKLASAGSISLVQDADISLAALTSVGAAVLKSNAVATKLTSVSAPVLATATSFNNGTANTIGGANVMTIDLGSLVRYPQASLGVVVKSTGDTTIDLAALTTTNATTGLQAALAFTLTGGDDLSLPLFGSGSVDAQNVKTLTLPKFVITANADLVTGSSKLETLAIHEVRAALAFAGYNNLTSIDVIGTVDTSVANYTIAGAVTISGTTTDLVTASFAGKLLSVDISGATDVTSITTSGMIRSFSLSGSNDIETLTLGHAGITGVTGSNAAALNATNSGQLVIDQNPNLVSFSATKIATLGKLHITNNASLTSFDLLSTLGLGTAAGTAAEVVDVNISGNALSGSVQKASAFNEVPAVKGAITQASLNNISTYIAAVEAAIKHGAQTVAATGDDDASWNRTTGVYAQADEASGGANTGYTLTSSEIVIDAVTSVKDSDGTDAGASANYEVVSVNSVGAVPAGYKNNNPISTIYNDYGVASTFTAGGVSSASITVDDDANVDTDLSDITGNAIFAANGITLTSTKGVNKRTSFTISGSVSTTSIASITFLAGGTVHTVSSTGAAAALYSNTIIKLVADFNTYTEARSSTLKWKASTVGNLGNQIVFHSGSYSGTTFVVDVFNTSYLPNATVAIQHPAGMFNTGAFGAQTLTDGYAITATSTSSPTASTIAGLGFSATAGVTVSSAGAVTGSSFTQKTPSTSKRREGEYAANGAGTAANIVMRATWL